MKSILIWDLPLRLFHWLFAASFVGAWLTAESDAWLSLHIFLGYLMLGLIGFRLVWGLAGSRYARFSTFLYGPRAGLAYLRQAITGSAARHLGHNPAGSQAVFLLLGLGLLVGLSGLFVQGGEEQHGAAAGLFGYAVGQAIKQGHEILASLMLLVVFGHLAGVALESWLHRENLARSMLTGRKQAESATPAARPHFLVAGLLLIAVAGFAAWWFHYRIADSGIAFVGKKLPASALWQEECGSCHQAFHPSLLPARSWRSLMAQQDRHFGDDLGLDAATLAELLAYAVPNAAEQGATEAAWKINRSVPANATPLRITETPYWLKKHREIAAADWKNPKVKSKANCTACHLDAEAGAYEDAAMRIPR
ncbi:MAG: cytochrome b/b6 domain-containing protein [Pseudomonadota bacterium]|nr:cytochrome b/b6 domain-containing protein [Pseudomonadota bacterium]